MCNSVLVMNYKGKIWTWMLIIIQ